MIPKGERIQVLVADDEPNLRRVVSAQLSRDGYDVHAVEDGAAALEVLRDHHIDLVITDLRMPKVDGMAVLRHCQEHVPDVPVILITAHGTVDNAVEAVKLGAFDYVTKPFDREEFRHVVEKAVRSREHGKRDVVLASEERGRYRLIGQSPGMLEVYSIIEKVADTPSTVLILGESGTGKELIARALHENSSRRDKPFIRVNCAAIPHELLESELFGYERGAFTGAVTSKPGRFELAHGGTLFLDEIAETPVEMQVKLLRAIQESEFERVGGIKTIQVDVRLVAATNRDLKKEIASGRFREDLFYRLNVVPIPLVPLRERHDDVPLLVSHFLSKLNPRLKKNVTDVEPEALEKLAAYGWPGNIRELENVLERALLFSDDRTIRLADLPVEIRGLGGTPTPTSVSSPAFPAARAHDGAEGRAADETPAGGVATTGEAAAAAGLKEAVKEAMVKVERDLIVRALSQTGHNVTHAARLLKISRKSLQTKMKELGLRDGTS
ncbi:MAG: sigma-54-dependent Fis family transcriptional regulator [Deltaproteobacteria bacterium]|nr:sigma-54-dependent Fis family transcriptional regulator [Deltaproteobacteria bacterium]